MFRWRLGILTMTRTLRASDFGFLFTEAGCCSTRSPLWFLGGVLSDDATKLAFYRYGARYSMLAGLDESSQ